MQILWAAILCSLIVGYYIFTYYFHWTQDEKFKWKRTTLLCFQSLSISLLRTTGGCTTNKSKTVVLFSVCISSICIKLLNHMAKNWLKRTQQTVTPTYTPAEFLLVVLLLALFPGLVYCFRVHHFLHFKFYVYTKNIELKID